MRRRWFFYTGVVVIVSSVLRIKLFYALISANVGKARLNLCFGAAFRTIRRVLTTIGVLKLLPRSARQSRRLKLLIERLNLSYTSSGSLRLAYDVSIFVDSLLVESLYGNSISRMVSFHEDLRAESTGIAIKRRFLYQSFFLLLRNALLSDRRWLCKKIKLQRITIIFNSEYLMLLEYSACFGVLIRRTLMRLSLRGLRWSEGLQGREHLSLGRKRLLYGIRHGEISRRIRFRLGLSVSRRILRRLLNWKGGMNIKRVGK